MLIAVASWAGITVPATRHGRVRWVSAVVLLVAVVGIGYASAEYRSPAVDLTGAVCGSAFRFHHGTGQRISGGELSPFQRVRISRECEASGQAAWQRGTSVAVTSGVLGLRGLIGVLRGLAMSRRRRRAGIGADGAGCR